MCVPATVTLGWHWCSANVCVCLYVCMHACMCVYVCMSMQTGLDPEVRRLIWNIVNEQRQGKTIILTTHSMEEAEVLCQRIGIMAKGNLRCLGVRCTPCTSTHTRTHIHIDKKKHAYTHTYIHTLTWTNIHTHTLLIEDGLAMYATMRERACVCMCV
jgi:ABC-type uncharacterized transport system ATPase subunit